MEELPVAHINFDPHILRDRDTEDRRIVPTQRIERRTRNHTVRRNRTLRNGERRRNQGNSAAIREAAVLGGALGRAANARERPSEHRRRQSSRRRQRQQTGENNPTSDEPLPSTNVNITTPNLPPNEPSTSTSDLTADIMRDQAILERNTEQSNSSWEDVSEGENECSADESSETNDDADNVENGTVHGRTDGSSCDKSSPNT